jgi:mono/diheme cytochrome c family protein
MKQMKAMSVLAVYSMALGLAVLITASPALGQRAVRASLRIQIPYPFVFGDTPLQPGVYTFAETQFGLTAQAAAHPPMMQIPISRMDASAEFLRDGTLVFDNSGSSRILAEIWIPGTEGFLLHPIPQKDQRTILVANYLTATGTVSGKAAFEQTCAHCHGEDGSGDPRADKFFKIVIPRLTSSVVQNKTDAELRAQIDYGNAMMPPVEVDEGGFRHRLPPQDVDAVIAYVRSLKK